MSKWKKILLIILRMLASLKLSSLVPTGRKEKDVCKMAKAMASPPPLGGTRGASLPKSARRPVSATSGHKYSTPLSRSQLSSLLRSESVLSQRKINLIVLHCSDTRPDQDFTVEKLAACHRARGFGDYPGYHVYIRRDGTCYYTRPLWMKGCHVKNFNARSIGICYEGGHEDSPPAPPFREGSGNHRVVPPHEVGALHLPFGRGGKYCDNRTKEQILALQEVFATLKALFPDAKILGHNELNPHKACPCLSQSAMAELRGVKSEE